MTEEIKRLKAELSQFTDSGNLYRHFAVKHIHYTNGAKYLAITAGACWLLDELSFAQSNKQVAAETFQLWKLTVNSDESALLICEDGNGKKVFSKHIGYTDFPLEEISLYCVNNTILLLREY